MPEEQSTATETSKVLKAFSLEECKKHTTEQSCWLIIHGKVYDVTEFLEEHPGGYDIVVSSAGRDATQDFEEIGHSNSARATLAKYLIGEFEGGDSAPAERVRSQVKVAAPAGPSALVRTIQVLLPLLVVLAAFALNYKQ